MFFFERVGLYFSLIRQENVIFKTYFYLERSKHFTKVVSDYKWIIFLLGDLVQGEVM